MQTSKVLAVGYKRDQFYGVKKQEIFREREFRVVPETMRNEELLTAEHYLGL